MSFTYSLSDANETNKLISKVRLEIGDTQEGLGVRPNRNQSNFTDEEIQYWLTEEDNDPMLASARACDALASAWSIIANETNGPRKIELGKVAQEWRTHADRIRSVYGSSIGIVL